MTKYRTETLPGGGNISYPVEQEPLTVQILKDVFDAIEHYYGKEGLEQVAAFARLKNRTRESNKLMDELEAAFGPFDRASEQSLQEQQP